MKLLKVLGVGLIALVIIGGVGLWVMSGQMTPGVALGSATSNVTVQTQDGQPLALSSLKGKVILLDFWSST